jgi:Fe-S-cluster containining protein
LRVARRLAVLEHLYGVYDRFCGRLDGLACRKFCDTCCSCNVTLTTLEGLYLLQELEPIRRKDCLAMLAGDQGRNRFRPRYTTNHIAALCREGHAPPEDAVDHDGSRCPFLAEAACSLYPLRPFGCRCMLSRHPCGEQGYADLDDWLLTVNTVFLQTIEHIDCPGGFGNLQDVLWALGSEKRRAAYREGRPPLDALGLIPNHPAPMLMVPPVHRERIQPLLEEMQQGMTG